mmetsp:Transcript_20177/g.52031  ORF Transcript_20177/g.52031 Transcript_20177/m.52031 type:complete len:202 (+) Transcript_20177:167-772(+)
MVDSNAIWVPGLTVMTCATARLLVLHADVFVPTEAQAAADPNAITQRIAAVDVGHGRQSEGRVEGLHRHHGRAVEDAQSLLRVARVRLWRRAVRDSEVVDEEHVPLLIRVGEGEWRDAGRALLALRRCAVRRVVRQARVEQIVVLVEKLPHLLLVEKAQRLFVFFALHVAHVEHSTCHSEVQVNRLALRDRVLVHERVQHT